MKPILVHCHIYYPQIWPELKECIHNIEPHPFKLFVTMVEKHPDIIDNVILHFPQQKYAFVAGTMFIGRASVFKYIQNLHLTFSDFPDPKGEHKTQLVHIIERLFGHFVYKNGFIVRDSLIPPETEQKYHKKEYIKMKFIYPIVRFFYQKKITKSGKIIIKICKIPVYRRKNV